MKIVIAASGSRGEVQPYVALALALQARGHHVAIATEMRVKPLVEEFKLEYRQLVGDPTGLLFEPGSQEILASGSMMQLMSISKKWDEQFNRGEILKSYVTACEGAELVIGANLTLTQSLSVSEYLNCPWIPMILGPTLPTREFPLWVFPNLSCCSCLNKWSYTYLMKMYWNNERTYINPWRIELGLPPITFPNGVGGVIDTRQPPIIVACSPMVCGPKRAVPDDYPSNVHMYGWTFVTTDEAADDAVDAELRQFVEAAGQPLVYLGFGSMPAPRPEELLRTALQACIQSGCKGVCIAGWSVMDTDGCRAVLEEARTSGRMFVTKSAPHDWLFPRTSCIVHHCGIGTTAAALRSGVPQVPCPVMMDQPHNANTILGLGVAPAILPFAKLTAARLAPLLSAAIATDVAGAGYRRRAQECAEQIREESTSCMGRYCDIIEQYSASYRAEMGSSASASVGADGSKSGGATGTVEEGSLSGLKRPLLDSNEK